MQEYRLFSKKNALWGRSGGSRAEKAGQVLMRSSSAATRLAACLNGDAVAETPCFQADNIAGLTRLAGPDLVGSLELWLLTRADMAKLGHACGDGFRGSGGRNRIGTAAWRCRCVMTAF